MLGRKTVTISGDLKPLPQVAVNDENNSVTDNAAPDTIAYSNPYNRNYNRNQQQKTRNNLFNESVKGSAPNKTPSAFNQQKEQHYLHAFEQGLLASDRSVGVPHCNTFKSNLAEIADLDSGYSSVIRQRQQQPYIQRKMMVS